MKQAVVGQPCDTDDQCGQCEVCFRPEGPAPFGTCQAALDGQACNNYGCTLPGVCSRGSCDGGQPLGEGTPCGDSNACTGPGICKEGTCDMQPLEGLPCDDGNECFVDSKCVGTACLGAPGNDGNPCDDGNSCTLNTTCEAGICNKGEIEEDGKPCEDGNPCITGSTCGGGQCQRGQNADPGTPCDDGNQCTIATTCDETGTCGGGDKSDGLPCDDGNPCTKDTMCNAGECGSGSTSSGESCDRDGNLCTQDQCVEMECMPGGPLNCDDGKVCTDDICDPQKGCGHSNNTATCNDGNPCTTGDRCQAGSCEAGGNATSGTPCGSSGNTDCDNPDTCDGSGNCQLNNEAASFVCRSAVAGGCDVAETCGSGNTGACPTDLFVAVDTPCGSGSNTDCDNPDSCDGSGACLVNNELSTHVCRVAGTNATCDPAETCGSGNTGACPGNAFAGSGTPCGSSANTDCDNPDTCDGSGTCQNNNEGASFVCRAAAAGGCDVAETCGSGNTGACPTNLFAAEDTPCGSGANTDCDNPDTCNDSGSCQNNNEAASFVCRAAQAGGCDVAETCGASTGACPSDVFMINGTPCGSGTNTDCDNPDSCNNGACAANNEAANFVCRSAIPGGCDAAETCGSGNTGACPADQIATPGTPCGSNTNTDCDNPDSCDAAGVCQLNNEAANFVCRSAIAGGCDVAETCGSGNTGACPSDQVVTNGTPCGSNANTDCDNPDSCNNGACAANNEASSFVCRAAVAGGCDVAETCGASTGACPTDLFAAVNTPCGSNGNTDCDNPDTCNGSGSCQTNNEAPNFVCRAAVAGGCDVAETCGGSTGACPTDLFVTNGTPCGSSANTDCDNPDTCNAGSCAINREAAGHECRPQSDDCDVAETCNGTTDINCPADAIEPSTTVCRGTGGVCDVEDHCDGTNKACPADAKSTAQCRAASGTCDVAESCDGVANDCPADGVASSSTVCRGVAAGSQGCDIAENCDGAGKACPTDLFETAGVLCGSATDSVCDNPDTCNGAGSCAPNYEVANTPCGSSTDSECSHPDSCNGSGTCDPRHETAGTACSGGACETGVCELTPIVDAGSDAGDAAATDAAAPDPADASDDATAPPPPPPVEAGVGGTGGVPVFVLDASVPAGSGGVPFPIKDGGLPPGFDASFLDASLLIGDEELAKCDCSVPGRTPKAPLSPWAVLAVLGLLAVRRQPR
ncbi:MAG TPA: MYXO-CTERM sorting domain-containing protein [Polyangiaceae bacterium]|nr:MYXO-CTERM sorting domain-containing protein [Polyangiaceae bacterium]